MFFIRPMSDLHLELDVDFDIPHLATDQDTVLILAGDIGYAKKKYTYVDFIDRVSPRFKAVVYVLGNHDYWGSNLLSAPTKIWNELVDYDNVHVLENETVVIDGVAFIGATLWTNMNNHDVMTLEQARLTMNDYKKVRHGPPSEPWKWKLTPSHTVSQFIKSRNYIFSEIVKQKNDGNQVVVVTHHAPSFKSVELNRKGDLLNGAYVSELFYDIDDLQDKQPFAWIHGHLHESFDYMLSDTRVICNPYGYKTEDPKDLNCNFESTKVVSVT